MKIHKEGRKKIIRNTIYYVVLSAAALITLPLWASIPLVIIFTLYLVFIIRFFRVPTRTPNPQDTSLIYSPADGTIVAIEEVYESEYIKDDRIQVSVFMSIWNIHINWFPIGGRLEYYKHHNGTFRVAWHPKSCEENERTTTVLNTGEHLILFRQIAGYVARRIINYTDGRIGDQFSQSDQFGFIKFGSRVDIFLPIDSEIHVKIDDKVIGTQTLIATLSKTADK